MVDGTSDQFLSRSAFASNQDGCIRWADGLYGIKDLCHCGTLADHILWPCHFGDSLAQTDILLLRTLVSNRLPHQVCDLIRIEWLGYVVVSSVLQSGYCGFDGRIPGHHDDCQFGINLM